MTTIDRSITFTLREVDGRVDVAYGVNDDPVRWGFDLLGFDMDIAARGFPVMEARTEYPAQGYRGLLGWIQVVRCEEVRKDSTNETIWVAPDIAPHALVANTPYSTFGIEPVMFDAPASDEQNVNFLARTFLAYTPDCLVSPVVEPVCGFVWGYDIEHGSVSLKDLRPGVANDWVEMRKMLGIRLPTWTFGGDEWKPLDFDS